MKKLGCLIIIVLSAATARCQSLNGTYFSLELDGLNVDTTGNVHFYMSDSFPSQKWFHEVKVIVEGDKMVIEKYPVYFDGMHYKKYSASDGGFLTYQGNLVKTGDVYISKAMLFVCDYIDFTGFQPPVLHFDSSRKSLQGTNPISENHTIDTSRFEKFKAPYGLVYLPKGIIRMDCIIRSDKQGVWLNNRLFYRKRD